jgi:pimeloyl-ACP methyl ester carboxylesterase
MNRRVLFVAAGVAIAILLVLLIRNIRIEHFPVHVEASPSWQPYVARLDADRQPLAVVRDGVTLEAELFLPHGGGPKKGAMVFAPGSGDSLYQNYAPGLIETYVLDLFLARDTAVLLINKRGMGLSQGSWVKNDFQGRADDLHAGVRALQAHDGIDPARIGLIGHSQGGWIVSLAAAQHDDVAFFVSLAGPTTTVAGNMQDNYWHHFRCQGLTGEQLYLRVEKQMATSRFGAELGEIVPFGMFGFDAGIIDYDPSTALQTVSSPGLLVYASHDRLVSPALNVQRLGELFDGAVPDRLTAVTIPAATHSFRVVGDTCASYEEISAAPLSVELTATLEGWLGEQGF